MSESITSRFRAVKQEWDAYCDHPKCEQLHQNRSRFHWVRLPSGETWHNVIRTEWIIIDAVTGQRAGGMLSDAYDTRRNAVLAIRTFGPGELLEEQRLLDAFDAGQLHDDEAVDCDDCGGTGSVPAEASAMVDGDDDDGHAACPSCVRDERADMIAPVRPLFRDCGDERTVDGSTVRVLESTANLTGSFYASGLDTPEQVRNVLTSLTLDAQELDGDYGHARIAMAFADGVRRHLEYVKAV
jgi:hypothetical protein